jgi:hypothetical protein
MWEGEKRQHLDGFGLGEARCSTWSEEMSMTSGP